jgi:uncharacterized protein YqcC (DUF446 family)
LDLEEWVQQVMVPLMSVVLAGPQALQRIRRSFVSAELAATLLDMAGLAVDPMEVVAEVRGLQMEPLVR